MANGIDRPYAVELFSYAVDMLNPEAFYKNLATKKAQGKYNREKAVKLMRYLIDRAMHGYMKEYGMTIKANTATRNEAARMAVERFQELWEGGELDHYIPKKYKAKFAGGERNPRTILDIPARRVRVTRQGIEIETTKSAAEQLRNLGRVKNVEGYLDKQGKFRPIRGTTDYSRRKAGDEGIRRIAKKKKATKRKRATRRTTRRR